ncbi:MAG: hypothetical protein HHAS10_06700 [Candidatus Altimarinota bacterium]
MLELHPFISGFLIVIGVFSILYTVVYTVFSNRVKAEERALLILFLRKVSKIPALIEVMRPYVVKGEAFDALIQVHTDSIIEASNSLYDVLEHNARIQNEFLFLMKLSVHSKDLQKHEYFLYIRDFIIDYEKNMKQRFQSMNQAIRHWNSFVHIKNATGIGWLYPGKELAEVI